MPYHDTFFVVAGKYDGNKENCKFVDTFRTFIEAVIQWQNVNDYPWARIEWKSPNNVKYDVTPTRME